jgi:hypothetical protein
MSDSQEYLIKVDLFGIGRLHGRIIRHLAPLSADAIIDKMPFVLRGRFSFGSKTYWTLPGMELYKGSNPKSNKEAKRGDIIYNPKTDELLIVLQDIMMDNKINKIGEITDHLDLLLNAKNGLNTKISRRSSPLNQ